MTHPPTVERPIIDLLPPVEPTTRRRRRIRGDEPPVDLRGQGWYIATAVLAFVIFVYGMRPIGELLFITAVLP